MKNMTDEEKGWPVVAMLSGENEVIEAIVKVASRKADCKMNWGIFGGRAIVHANGDKATCRAAIAQCVPQTDITGTEKYAKELKN